MAVQRLMRGESLKAAARALNAPVHRVSDWRDRAPKEGERARLLKDRKRNARDEEIERLQAKAGEIARANEALLRENRQAEGRPAIARLEVEDMRATPSRCAKVSS